MKFLVRTIQIAATATFLCWIIFFTGCAASKKGKEKQVQPVSGKAWSLLLPGNMLLNLEWVPAGTFTMGSPVSEPGRKADESPETLVTLTKDYWLGKTELTIGQWKAVMGESLKEHVIKMLNDETVYDFGGQKKSCVSL